MRKLFIFTALILLSSGFSKAQEKTEGAPVIIKISSKFLSPGQEYTLSGQTQTGNQSLNVKIEILSGSSVLETEKVQTDATGKYETTRKAPANKGIYQAKVTGADGKRSDTISFAVAPSAGVSKALAEHFDKPIQLAQKGLETANLIVNSLPPSAAKEEFKIKYEDIYNRLSQANEQAEPLKSAFVKLMEAVAENPSVMPDAKKCIDELNGQMKEMQQETERFSWEVSQKSLEQASACDYMAFAVQTLNYVSKMTSIASGITETIMNFGKSEAVSYSIKEATSNEDLQFLANITIKAAISFGNPIGALIGSIVDLSSYVAQKMYKLFCAEMKGPFTGKFYAEFEAGQGKGVWEKYNMSMKGILTLRYGKGRNSQKGIAVTGEFEGYYYDYHFWADITAVEPLPKDILIIDQIIVNPSSGYFSDYITDIDKKNQEKGKKREPVSLGPVAAMTPGNFRINVKGAIKNNKLLLTFDDKAPINQIKNMNEYFQLILITANPIVPIPLIKTFSFPVAPARSIFIVGLGKEGQEFDLKGTEEIYAEKKITGERTLSDGEIRLNTTLDIQMKTTD